MVAETLPQTTPIEPTTPIKPSEAIRLGCLIAPVQAFGTFTFDGRSACALTAMKLGFGDPDGKGVPEQYERFVFDHPLGKGSVAGRVMGLNDTDRWPREHIADWLEGLGL